MLISARTTASALTLFLSQYCPSSFFTAACLAAIACLRPSPLIVCKAHHRLTMEEVDQLSREQRVSLSGRCRLMAGLPPLGGRAASELPLPSISTPDQSLVSPYPVQLRQVSVPCASQKMIWPWVSGTWPYWGRLWRILDSQRNTR